MRRGGREAGGRRGEQGEKRKKSGKEGRTCGSSFSPTVALNRSLSSTPILYAASPFLPLCCTVSFILRLPSLNHSSTSAFAGPVFSLSPRTAAVPLPCASATSSCLVLLLFPPLPMRNPFKLHSDEGVESAVGGEG